MWLLSTDRAELRYFQNNYDATGGYAILSHTWTGDEQTLQEVRDIIKRCQESGTNPRDDPALSEKIKQCCIIAEKYGYRWVWIDSCCIDKTSSSELSEAINSMFRWYKEAEICFAYLADVPSDCELHKPGSEFRESRWHSRGWTLQELIAPDFLIFLSRDWHELGNRADLAWLLQEITGIPTGILTGEHLPANYSVCIRMSWACKRTTTRVEDEAYCLMGLFGVSMPTNYGEGKQAFTRLQYEIMQRTHDLSLFVFGHCVPQDHGFTFLPEEDPTSSRRYLLANSPREFKSGAVYLPDFGTNTKQPYPPLVSNPESTDPFEGGVKLPRVAATSYGVELRVPVIDADNMTIAVILCQRNGRNIGVFLTRDRNAKDPERPRYFTCCVHTKPDTGSAPFSSRLADLGDDLYNMTVNGKMVKASWRTVYVVPTVSDLDTRNSTTPMLMINCDPASRFRVPRWLVARFTALQFTFREDRNTETLQVLEIYLSGTAQIYVSFGCCIQFPDKPPLLWAKVDVLRRDSGFDETHACPEDHINSESWATHSKFFGNTDRGVRLSLMPSTRTPDGSKSFDIYLEPLGRVLGERVKGPGGASMFPPLADLEKDGPHSNPKESTASSSSHISSSQTTVSSSSTPPETVRRSSTHAPTSYPSVFSLVRTPPSPPMASPSPSSTSSSVSSSSSYFYTRPSRIPRLSSRSTHNILTRERPQGRSGGRHNLEESREIRRQGEPGHRFQTPSPLPTTGSRRQPGTSAANQRISGQEGNWQTPWAAWKRPGDWRT